MIDFKKHMASIVTESDYQLGWAEPEHWVRSELFQRLKIVEEESGQQPLAMEIPYYTRIRSTGRESDAGPPYGKWIDLLVVDPGLSRWQWIELKVIHAANHKSQRNAVKPFVNDTASLLGFSLDWTLLGWKEPLDGMKLSKVEEFLRGAANPARVGIHHFASVLLLLRPFEQTGLEIDQKVILENIKARIHARGWTEYEKPPVSFETAVESVGKSRQGHAGTLMTAKWTIP